MPFWCYKTNFRTLARRFSRWADCLGVRAHRGPRGVGGGARQAPRQGRHSVRGMRSHAPACRRFSTKSTLDSSGSALSRLSSAVGGNLPCLRGWADKQSTRWGGCVRSFRERGSCRRSNRRPRSSTIQRYDIMPPPRVLYVSSPTSTVVSLNSHALAHRRVSP